MTDRPASSGRTILPPRTASAVRRSKRVRTALRAAGYGISDSLLTLWETWSLDYDAWRALARSITGRL